MQACGIHEGQPLRITPWAEWGTLGDLFTWRVSFQDVVQYIRQIASALAYLHAQHLVHRDLKPNNILVGQHHQLLLNDFEWTVDYRCCRSTIGTPIYAAPEQKRGHPCPASDQYALGVMVYQWLSGEASAGNRLFSPLSAKRSLLPHPLDEILRIALAWDPDRRFASVQLFADTLEQASQRVSFLTPSQNIAAIGTDNPGHLT
jgi:serine/threonine protein kinase